MDGNLYMGALKDIYRDETNSDGTSYRLDVVLSGRPPPIPEIKKKSAADYKSSSHLNVKTKQ